jgi:hypothetical protein
MFLWLQRTLLVVWLFRAIPCTAQDASGNAPPAEPVPIEKQRVLGVLPNNRTTDASVPFAPISAKRKMTIAYRDSFDYPVYPTAAVFALIYQAENQNPSFGQGVSGYAKRFASAYGDQLIGNMMTEGIVPALTREDPRYFRLGGGPAGHRLVYALTRIFVTRTDSNHRTFNVAEFGGNAIAVAISNAWYPDTRTAKENAEKLCIQVGTDALSNVLKEFGPDIMRRLKRKHTNH